MTRPSNNRGATLAAVLISILILLAALIAGCGGGGGGSSSSPQSCVKRGPVLSDAPIVIAYGDSTMGLQGPKLGVALGVEFDNRAVGGTMLHQAMNGACEYPQDIAKELAGDPDARVVLENFGINEAKDLYPVTRYETYLRRFVDTVRAAGKTPVIVTPIHVLDSHLISQGHLATLAQIGRNVAADMDVRLVDVYALEAVPSDFRADLIHPIPSFSQRIADYTATQIKDLL